MALVIDAMDLLYSGNFDGFCIVSSDSDFTRLASRLRESGLTVYGFGEKKTPEAFRKACDKFIYTEIFRPEKQRQEKEKNSGKNTPAAAPDALSLLKRAVRENADDLGWANLGPIGSYISKINPDFDSRLYGYGKLSDLIKSFDIFEHRTDNNQLQVRRRKSADKPTERSSENPVATHHAEETVSDDPNAAQKRKTRGKKTNPTKNENTAPSPTTDTAQPTPVKPEPAAKSSKLPVTRVIPAVQQAVDTHADEQGWARLSDVSKQLAAQGTDPQQYGFETINHLIHAIYTDWLEIKKAGRGERLRVNKRFTAKG